MLVPTLLAMILLPVPQRSEPREIHDPLASKSLVNIIKEVENQLGQGWRLTKSPKDGSMFLYGGRLSRHAAANASRHARSQDASISSSHCYIDILGNLFQFDPATLKQGEEHFLPLGLVGLTDKSAVSYSQFISGVRVSSASVNLLMSAEGDLIAAHVRVLPIHETPRIRQQISQLAASRVGSRWFRNRAGALFAHATGRLPEDVALPVPIVLLATPEDSDYARSEGTLALAVNVQSQEPVHQSWTFYLDPSGLIPSPLLAHDNVSHYDVGGTVTAYASPGTLPDDPHDPNCLPNPFNPEEEVPLQRLHVFDDQGNVVAVTDENGDFTIPGQSTMTLTFRFDGQNCRTLIDNPEQSTLTLSGTGNHVRLNESQSESSTGEANVYRTINLVRDWTRQTNPFDPTLDEFTLVDFNVGIKCGNGNYARPATSGSGEHEINTGYEHIVDCINDNHFCPSPAYSTVIVHEEGHAQLNRYRREIGPPYAADFDEGVADSFTILIYDDPINAKNHRGPGTFNRDLSNPKSTWGSLDYPCPLPQHVCGQRLAGAFWLLRRNLVQQEGYDLGIAISNALFNGWLIGFDQRQIDPIIEQQLLTLDDNDGQIENGTPHFAAIDRAFRDLCFPGVDVPHFSFEWVVRPEDTQDDDGPYGVAIQVSALANPPVQEVVLNFRCQDPTFEKISMTRAGNVWIAEIPPCGRRATIEFFVEATDRLGNVEAWPRDHRDSRFERDTLFGFLVGKKLVHLSDDFEGPPDEAPSNLFSATGSWERAAPEGHSGVFPLLSGWRWSDPPEAYSGSICWGTDLTEDGRYEAEENQTLTLAMTAPANNNRLILSFRRWLTARRGESGGIPDGPIFPRGDRVTVLLNDVPIWEGRGPGGCDILNSTWNDVFLSLDSSLIVPQERMTIGWSLGAERLAFGGWNIDDVEVLRLDRSPNDLLPKDFGPFVPGTLGAMAIGSGKQQSLAGNGDFIVLVKNAIANAPAKLLIGTQVVTGSGLIVTDDVAVVAGVSDIFGRFEVPFPLDDSLIPGQKLFAQCTVEDQGAPGGLAITKALEITVYE